MDSSDGLVRLFDAFGAPFLDPAQRTWWPGLLLAAGLAWVWPRASYPNQRWHDILRHPSARLDVQLLLARQLLQVLWGSAGLSLAYTIASHAVLHLDHTLGRPEVPAVSAFWTTVLYSGVLFLAWDASRYLLHLAMHRIPLLWAFHQVHHSAEVLTPLTFHRIHPVESALYQLRGGITTGTVTALFYWLFRDTASVWTWAGVPVLGLMLNIVFGNLRHSHVWMRFPTWAERYVMLSPAQHQLHHSIEEHHYDRNMGTWLPWWDHLAGTLAVATVPPRGMGLTQPNHAHDLLSAWVGPFVHIFKRARTGMWVVLLASLLPQSSWAEDEETKDDDSFGTEIIVYAPDKTPRVASAATRIDEEQLEQFEYDDIERVLAQVPGVTTRGEDGYGLRPNIGIRGVNSDRSAKVTLLEDGVPLSPAPYAAPAAYYFPMSTRLVGVEVFKGAAATRFGPQTVAGAINLLTRDVPRYTDAEIDLAGGMRQTGRAHAWVGTGNDAAGVLLEGVHLQTAGFKELDGGGPTGFTHSELMAKARWTPAAAHTLGLKLGYAHERSNETYLGLNAEDYAENPYRRYTATQNALMRWHRSQVEVSHLLSPRPGWSVRTVAYHHWMTRAWTKFNRFGAEIDPHALLQSPTDSGLAAVFMDILRGEEDTTSPEQALHIGTNDRTFHAWGIQSNGRYSRLGRPVEHTVDFGLRFHGDDVRRIHTEDPYDMRDGTLVRNDTPRITLLDADSRARALSAHLHEDLRWRALHVLPGGRVEHIWTDEAIVGSPSEAPVARTIVLPGLGTMVDVSRSLSWFGGVYRGFSPVSPGEPATVTPELSWNTETGIRWVSGDTHVELVGFHNEYSNLTGQCTLSGGCDGNQLDSQFSGGAARVRGIESSAGWVLMLPGPFSMPVEGSYTWTDGQFRTTFSSAFPQFGEVSAGDALPYVPQHQAYGRVTLAHPRFDVGAGLSYRSALLDQAGTWPASPTDVPPLTLLDGGVRFFAHDRVTVYSTGTNLLGSTAITSWRPMGARPTAPLQVMVGVEVRAAPP